MKVPPRRLDVDEPRNGINAKILTLTKSTMPAQRL